MAYRAMAVPGPFAITQYWDEALAVGLGVVVVDLFSDQVAAFLGKWVPADWVNVATETAIGFGVFALGEYFAPSVYRVYTRLAGFGAIGLAVAHTIAKLFGLGGEHSSNPGGPQASSECFWPYTCEVKT